MKLAMSFLAIWAVAVAAVAGDAAPAQAVDTPAATTDASAAPSTETAPAATYDAAAWKPQLEKVRQQLELLRMFGTATQFGGIKIPIPKGMQKIPLGLLGGMGGAAEAAPAAEGAKSKRRPIDLAALEKAGIEIYLKQVEFRDVAFKYDDEPKVMGDHPAIASLLDFAKLGLDVDVKTRVGRFPVGCDFRTGKLPFDFDLVKDGYALNILPEDRADIAQLDNVSVDLGGPVASRVLSKFFGGELAKVILEFAAGQTLNMDRGALLGNAATPESILRGILK